MFEFNLVEEKWIPCVMNDGSLKDKSLREVLTEATEIREIVGDSPPVTIALHRLLLAILHRALNAPQNYEEWNDYWQAKTWNSEGKLDKYLEDWKHRFDLFNEKRPFYQVGSVKDNVQDGAIIQLYFQAKANATLFEHSTLSNPNEVEPAEAARLLITFQGFDIGGIKADGAGGKRSPLMNNAICLIRGKSLFETLMLNWHSYNQDNDEPFTFTYEKDLPSWERKTETEVKERRPDGYIDLLTWQSRRILFKPEKNENNNTVIKKIVIMKGFHFPASFETFQRETMMAFSRSDKKGFYSIGFNESKSLWRDSHSLFQTIKDEQYRPKMLDWVNELAYENILQRTDVLPLDFFGIKNSTDNEAKLLFWQQDKFNLPLVYLGNNDLLIELRDAIKFSEDFGKILYLTGKSFVSILLAPNSDKSDAKQPDAKDIASLIKSLSIETKYWSKLETQFQVLLSDLPSNKDTALRNWFIFVEKEAKQAFMDTANSFSSSANEQKAFVKADKTYQLQRYALLFGDKKKQGNSTYRKYLLGENEEVNQ